MTAAERGLRALAEVERRIERRRDRYANYRQWIARDAMCGALRDVRAIRAALGQAADGEGAK